MKDKLSGMGIEIKPGSPASRTLKQIAQVSADVANSSEEALRVAKSTIEQAAEAARSAIHEATAPKASEAAGKKPGAKRASRKAQP